MDMYGSDLDQAVTRNIIYECIIHVKTTTESFRAGMRTRDRCALENDGSNRAVSDQLPTGQIWAVISTILS